MIEKVTRVGLLYDIYGNLLTERQRQLVEMYYFDDWSLAEAAEFLQISRQAVHDNLRRSEEQLEGYESALGMLAYREQTLQAISGLQAAWQRAKPFVPADLGKTVDKAIEALEQQI